MKKQLLLFTFLLLNITVYAQEKQRTLGILISPNMDTHGPEDNYRDRRLSYSMGLFYDHQLTHRFGINTGLLLDTERYRNDYSRIRLLTGEWPERAKVRVNAIEVPVNLTFCFNPANESGYRAFLFSGITLRREFFSKFTGYYYDKIVVAKGDGYSNNLWSDSFLNLGFEVRKNVGSHYCFAVGSSAKFRPAHSLDVSSHYRESIILNLNLKFGRNL